MSIKLNDTQLLLLGGASQREDRCAVIPVGAKRRAALRAVSQLLEAGLLKEVRSKAEAPVWRRDEDSGLNYSLRLTVAGQKAIAIEDAETIEEAGRERHAGSDVAVAENGERGGPPSSPDEAVVAPEPTYAAPREGSKLAQVLTLLERRGGATLDELVGLTGWLPHTTRAALTGLRKRGYAVARDRSNKERGSVYLIASAKAEDRGATPADTPTASEASLSPPEPADRKRTRRAA